jgi:rRNA-processing protein FCF1
VKRYGNLISNIAENFNSYILAINDNPLISLIEKLYLMPIKLFEKRKIAGQHMTGVVVSKVKEKLEELKKKATNTCASSVLPPIMVRSLQSISHLQC